MKEIWKDVPGANGNYQVSNLGRVKSVARITLRSNGYPLPIQERILKQKRVGENYMGVWCNGKAVKTAVLVAMAFLNHKPNGHKILVDHINNNSKDDRLCNLQLITNRENASKDQFRKNPTSKYTGVSFDKSREKWATRIYFNGKSVHLGRFNNEIDASNAYQLFLNEIK